MVRNYTILDVLDTAGKELTDRIIKVLNKEEKVVRWFYKKRSELYENSPFEYCLTFDEENIQKVYDILGRLEEGIWG